MSADNWTTCPRCDKRHLAEVEAAEKAIAEAYGKVQIEKFDRIRANAEELRRDYEKKDGQFERTLREDYEFYGAEGGVLSVHYSARCQADGCGFSFKLDDQHDMGA